MCQNRKVFMKVAKVPLNQIGHNDVCNHTCPRTFLRDLGVDKSTDVSAKVRNKYTPSLNISNFGTDFENLFATWNLIAFWTFPSWARIQFSWVGEWVHRCTAQRREWWPAMMIRAIVCLLATASCRNMQGNEMMCNAIPSLFAFAMNQQQAITKAAGCQKLN